MSAVLVGIDAIAVMSWRSARHALRSPDALIVTAALPIALLLLMTVVFGGAFAPQTGSYTDYVVPGVIAMCAAYGASQVAISVSVDARSGVIDRYRTMDIPTGAPIIGHITVAAAKNVIAALLVLLTAALLRANVVWSPVGLIGLALVVVLITLAVGTLAAAVGLSVSSPEAAAGLSFIMLFLPYLSSAFVPVATLPEWLHPFARVQPFTPMAETLRATLFADATGSATGMLLIWTAGILACSCAALTIIWKRQTR